MRALVDAMEPVALSIMIGISEDGFRAQAVNSSNSWIADGQLESKIFEKIDVTEKRVFHIKMKDFADFIKTAKRDESLVIRAKDDVMELELESSSINKKITLRLMEMQKDFDFMDIVNRSFHSKAEIDAELFNDAIKAASLGEGLVQLKYSQDKLYFSAQSESKARIAQAEILYGGENERDVSFKKGETYLNRLTGEEEEIPSVITAKYILDHIKQSAKIGKSGQVLQFSMDNMGPIRMVLEIEDKEGFIAYAITPVEETEMN